MAFADVLGHDRIRDLLGRALVAGRLPPALLFVGPRGVGKRTLALAVARALLCPDGASLGDACGKCPACHRTSKGLHPDLFLAEPEGATLTLKIERVRELVREIDARPFEAAARAVLIDDAHTMTEQAQNALLKSLEEPPADLARVPGDAVAADAPADDPLALPDAAPRPAAGGPARGDALGAPVALAGGSAPARVRLGRQPGPGARVRGRDLRRPARRAACA